ncbi:MAG: hypothetical protein HKN43_08935 [Rhodothermales bacterium]|nr:hypothetical protein [Rhodothermales bacterium]
MSAHPPFSIVVNSNGQVYYSDLENIWMVDTDGSKRIVLHHIHNHELWLDDDDNLYGEDVQNVGENYRHRVWRLDTNSDLSNVVEWTSGHPSDIGGIATIRNHRNESVILQRPERAIVVGRESASPRYISLDGIDGHIHELTISPSGDIFVAIGSTIYRIEDGAITVDLYTPIDIERSLKFRFVHDRHALMGMYATDTDVYVSVYAGQYMVRIDESRKIHDGYRSAGGWSPSGVSVDDTGNVWVLEFSLRNQARVVRLDEKGTRTIF